MDEDELAQTGHMAEDVFVRQMKRRRTALGLSQAHLASRITDLGGSLYQQTIAKIEAGQRAVRLQEADLIAQALRSTVSEMLALSIGDPESSPETMDIDELITQVKALQRRRYAYASEVHEAREQEAAALARVEAATHAAAAASMQVRTAVARMEETERELHHLSRVSLERQSEFNARYGPRWREKLSAREPITIEMVQGQNLQYLERMRELAESKPMNSRDREVWEKSIQSLEERLKAFEEKEGE